MRARRVRTPNSWQRSGCLARRPLGVAAAKEAAAREAASREAAAREAAARGLERERDQEREGVFRHAQAALAANGGRLGNPDAAADCQSWADATLGRMGLALSTHGERAFYFGDPAAAGPSHYTTPSERVEVSLGPPTVAASGA
jgi:hypothetical protein